MRYLRTAFVALVAALALVVSACGGSDDSSSKSSTNAGSSGGEPLVIGAPTARTGFFNVADMPATQMLEFAVEDYNARGGAGGHPMKVIYADTKSDPNQGTNAALQVIDDGADVIFPSVDYDIGRAAATTGVSKGKLVVGAAGSARFGVQGIGPLAFNVGISTNAEGAAMAEYSYDRLGAKRTYELSDTTIEYSKDVCTNFETRYEELGGELAGKDTFKNSDASIASQITRIKNAGDVDQIVLCSYNPGAASAIRQIRAAGIDTPIMASASMDGKYWLRGIPNLSRFHYVAYGSLYGDDPEATVNELFDRYRKATGEEPTQSTSLVGYRAVQLIAKGVDEAGSTDGRAIAAKLDQLKDFPTIMGPISYTPELHFQVNNPLRMMQIENGKPSFVELVSPEQVPPVSLG